MAGKKFKPETQNRETLNRRINTNNSKQNQNGRAPVFGLLVDIKREKQGGRFFKKNEVVPFFSTTFRWRNLMFRS
jgi:hypothetical protein